MTGISIRVRKGALQGTRVNYFVEKFDDQGQQVCCFCNKPGSLKEYMTNRHAEIENTPIRIVLRGVHRDCAPNMDFMDNWNYY